MFASPPVGAAFSTPEVTQPALPSGTNGASRFIEQLERATAQSADPGLATGTAEAHPSFISGYPTNLPAISAGVVSTEKPAEPRPMPGVSDESTSVDSRAIALSVESTLPAITAPSGKVVPASLRAPVAEPVSASGRSGSRQGASTVGPEPARVDASDTSSVILSRQAPSLPQVQLSSAPTSPEAPPRGFTDEPSGNLSASSYDLRINASPARVHVPSITLTGKLAAVPESAAPYAGQSPVPDNLASAAVTEFPTPVGSSPSDQTTGRVVTPAEAPDSSTTSAVASTASMELLDREGSLASAWQIQTYAPVNPVAGQLAFAARIRPEVAAPPAQHLTTSGISSSARDVVSSQPVKSTGETSAKDSDTGDDEPQDTATPWPSSMSPASKSLSGKDAVASTANSVEPNTVPPAQPIPQPLSTSIPVQQRFESDLQANTSNPVQSAAVPEPVHPLLDRPVQASSSARNISLQVEAASGQTVDIRLSTRSGDLNVAVRAGDDDTVQNLRQGLGDLETRLAQSGYHADSWHPSHNGSATEPAAPANNQSNSSFQQQSQSGSGSSQQNRGQRNNDPSNRPQWFKQLASSLKAESTDKGNTNGIRT